eukprot:5693755-Amphidinium_carterae.1
MDNKIITYEAFGRFKFVARKQFKGHMNSGQLQFSPAFLLIALGRQKPRLEFRIRALQAQTSYVWVVSMLLPLATHE